MTDEVLILTKEDARKIEDALSHAGLYLTHQRQAAAHAMLEDQHPSPLLILLAEARTIMAESFSNEGWECPHDAFLQESLGEGE